MRLVTYDRGGVRRLGALVAGTVVDLPDAVGHPSFPATMEALGRVATEKGSHTFALAPAGNQVYAFLPATHRAAIYQASDDA